AESLDSTFSPRTSQINPAGDSDWFRFDAVEGRSYRIFVDPAEGEGALADPKLTLYDGDGNQIATDDNGGKGKGARIAFIPTHSGSFIAAASAASATESGRYTLRVSDYEVPNGPGTDEVLDEAGDARASRIDMAGDKDWYGFTAAEGGVYQITVVGSGDNPLARPSAALLTDDGVTISMADAARGGRASVTYRAAKEATLYVQVSSVGAGMGDYTVTLTRTNR
ncbi:MAG: PPC domain-containing protein, partial [Hyphomonadaceae bacterium]